MEVQVDQRTASSRARAKDPMATVGGDGRIHLRCPRCGEKRAVSDYTRLGTVGASGRETNPIVKCPPPPSGCGWLFSPLLNVDQLDGGGS